MGWCTSSNSITTHIATSALSRLGDALGITEGSHCVKCRYRHRNWDLPHKLKLQDLKHSVCYSVHAPGSELCVGQHSNQQVGSDLYWLASPIQNCFYFKSKMSWHSSITTNYLIKWRKALYTSSKIACSHKQINNFLQFNFLFFIFSHFNLSEEENAFAVWEVS